MAHFDLEKWLGTQCGLADFTVTPLAGDASFRRYFRVTCEDRSLIAMDASAEKQSCVPFAAIAKTLQEAGVTAPSVLFKDMDKGFLLLTDLGNDLYRDVLTLQNADALYGRAIDVLLQMQQRITQVKDLSLKQFDAKWMTDELNLFKEWFLEKYLLLELSHKTQKMLANTFDFVANQSAMQPIVFTHRDYHSANLMVLDNQRVGVLDFQDAFMGPVTYDLVSLLRDCYIAWPEKCVEKWVSEFWQKQALPNVSHDQFVQWFDVMGMQRHLKALLTFSRKCCRDGNESYLQHVPRTLHYVLSVSERYPECHALNQFLTEQVIEKCAE